MEKVKLLYVYLSAINVGKLNKRDELEPLCDLAVRRTLDEIIDHQKYPIDAAEKSTKARRSLGIGYIGLAHYLPKKGYKYDQKLAWRQVDKLTEHISILSIKVQVIHLQKKKANVNTFKSTKYSDGILFIDTYKKDVDELVNRELTYDWESFKKRNKRTWFKT